MLIVIIHNNVQCLHLTSQTAGADVNSSTPLGRTPLHIAAAQGHGHIVDLLLEKGELYSETHIYVCGSLSFMSVKCYFADFSAERKCLEYVCMYVCLVINSSEQKCSLYAQILEALVILACTKTILPGLNKVFLFQIWQIVPGTSS